MAAVWPPIGLAEPGLTLTASTPPPMASRNPSSAGLIASSARTCAVFGLVRSLVSWPAQPCASSCTPAWACASMKPGSTHFPVASTTATPDGTANPGPSTAAIFPSRSRTVPPSIGSPSTGTTRPPTIAVSVTRPILGPANPAGPRPLAEEEFGQHRRDHLGLHAMVVALHHDQPGPGDDRRGLGHRAVEPVRAGAAAQHQDRHRDRGQQSR